MKVFPLQGSSLSKIVHHMPATQHCTWPPSFILQAMSPQNGSTSPFWVMEVAWSSDTRLPPDMAPRMDHGNPSPDMVHLSFSTLVLFSGLRTISPESLINLLRWSSIFQAWGQSRGPIPGPLENSGLGLASTKAWCSLHQVWKLTTLCVACQVIWLA